MKLIYEFDYMDMGEGIVGVPVGKNAEHFNGVLNLNESAVEMLKAISSSTTPEEAHKKLVAAHPEDDPNEIGQLLCDFLNQLIRERLLIP